MQQHHETETEGSHTRVERNDGTEGSEGQSLCHGGRLQPVVIIGAIAL